jgi:gliding motility-associated-like protein
MKSHFYLTTVAVAVFLQTAHSQTNSNYTIDSLQHFNSSYWLSYLSRFNPSPSEAAEYLSAQKKQYIRDTYFPSQKISPGNPTIQQSCTNIDFEMGNLSGWTRTTGFNPLFNTSGCCPTSGGAQTIMTGTGVDPCGGFPVVCPGGNFSLRLGNNVTGGLADRIEQTFSVTASNANFTYKYAVVLQDPGHIPSQQPSFQIEMLDSSGAQIPCTFYNVAAGQNIPGFLNSTCPSVIYKPWTSVVVDLTSYIGQNVTIRYTRYDCALGGHYGYAYIDGSCMQFQLATQDSICPGGYKNLCAPTGFGSYVWNGPSMSNFAGQCATAYATGVYSVQTTLITGCIGPVFTYSIYNYAQPVAAFANVPNTCSKTVSFNNTSTISSGSIASYLWNFGDGNTSTLASPTHTYANPGTYSVSLIVDSNNGCRDTASQSFTIYSLPVVNFVAPVVCQSAAFTFTNNSTVASGSITSWVWSFGDFSPNSSLQNPSHTYTNSGNYVVNLNATSNFGCSNSNTTSVMVNAKPTIIFTANNSCIGAMTQFTNTSFVTGGTITSWGWDFYNTNVIMNTTQNPVYTYTSSGNYTVNLTAISNVNCANTVSNTVTVYPDPSVAFTANNACQGSTASFVNNSSIPAGNSISSYTWNFGNNATSTASNPSQVYATAGTYTITLSATSNNGCTSYIGQPITIYPLPVVNLSAPIVCENTGFTFTNTSTISSGSINSWLWTFGNSVPNSTLAAPTATYNTSQNYIVNLVATSNLGCVNNNSIVVWVNPKPNVNFSSTNVCYGNANIFNNTSNIPTGSIASWSWDFHNVGITDNTTQSPSYTYSTAGTYSVNLTAVSNANCISSSTKTITVNPNPVVNLVGNNVCNGAATTFSNQTTIGNGNTIITYNWNFGNSVSSNQPNPSMTYSTPGTYVVSLVATSNNNCLATNSISVSVYPNPQVNFSTSTACLNQATQFNNSTIISSGTIIKWRWDFDGNGTWDDSTASPTYVYPNYGNFNGKLYALSNNNCSGQKVNVVVVHANPVANFKANSTCLGDVTNFKDLSSSADGNIISYQWDFNGDNVIDNTMKDPNYIYPANGIFLCKLEVQTQYGCTNVMPKSVYVNAKPVPQFVSANNIGCPSLCTKFTNQSTIPTGSIVTTQWTFGDNSYPVYEKNPTHCYNTGNYNVTLKVVSDSGCISAKVMQNLVTVYPKPMAGFNYTPDEIDMDEPLIEVTDASTGASMVNYFINDGTNYNKPNFVHSFNKEITTKVLIYQLVTNSYGCTDSTYKVIDVKPSYAVYVPNAFTPNSDGLNDGWGAKGVGIEKFQMWVFDRWGHVIFETNDINKTWDGTVKGGSEPIKQDVYVWKAEVQDVFHKNHELIGSVTLLK